MNKFIQCGDCSDYEERTYQSGETVCVCKSRNLVTDSVLSCEYWDGYLRARELYLKGELK